MEGWSDLQREKIFFCQKPKIGNPKTPKFRDKCIFHFYLKIWPSDFKTYGLLCASWSAASAHANFDLNRFRGYRKFPQKPQNTPENFATAPPILISLGYFLRLDLLITTSYCTLWTMVGFSRKLKNEITPKLESTFSQNLPFRFSILWATLCISIPWSQRAIAFEILWEVFWEKCKSK